MSSDLWHPGDVVVSGAGFELYCSSGKFCGTERGQVVRVSEGRVCFVPTAASRAENEKLDSWRPL